MKKWIQYVTVGILALVLAACGNSADALPGTDASKKSNLSIEEVMNKAEEASDSLKSLHAEMEMSQTISTDQDDMSLNMEIDSAMDIVQEPFAMYQSMSMKMNLFGDMTMETEMYMVPDGMYMKESEEDLWMKMPLGDSDDFMDLMETSQDATVDFESLKNYVDDFTFEQTNDEYVLTLNASGDKFKKLIEDQLADSGMIDLMNGGEMDLLDEMEIHSIEYEIFIDKKTFYTNKFNLKMDMTMTADGETATIKQDMKASLSKFNEIDEIVVPQEIIDNAIEF